MTGVAIGYWGDLGAVDSGKEGLLEGAFYTGRFGVSFIVKFMVLGLGGSAYLYGRASEGAHLIPRRVGVLSYRCHPCCLALAYL